MIKVSKVAKIRNRYNQVPHLTQDTNGSSFKGLIRHLLAIITLEDIRKQFRQQTPVLHKKWLNYTSSRL